MNEARGNRRRRRILIALHDCIIGKGYAKTTLADIAQAAGMSPSHLLYYFPGKDAILEHYFENVAQRILQRLESFRTEAPESQIDLLAELFFAGKGITKSEIGFMLECFGVAVHDKKLRQEKAQLDRRCKAYLEELFTQSPNQPGARARDSAEIAYAMLIGLRTAVYFDEQFDLPQAHRLFRTSMLLATGYGQPNRAYAVDGLAALGQAD
jgi:AcrR family transcriptional regulator